MKAVIMAGGEGSRLRPLTCDRPKPLVPVCNRPVMAYVLDLLAEHGFQEVFVTLGYMPGAIQDHFGDTYRGMRLHHVVEESPLGTAGSVAALKAHLDGTFLVISGDCLTDLDLSEVVAFHLRTGAVATLAMTRVENPLEYGVIMTDREGRIRRFLEKPTWSEVFSDTVNTGIYVLEPSVLDGVPAGRMYDFSRHLFPALLRKGAPLYAAVAEGYWCDIGDPAAYLRANLDLLSGRLRFRPPARQVVPGVWVARDLPQGVLIDGPALIGEGCRLGPGTRLEAGAVLGPGTVTGENAVLRRSVTWAGVRLGAEATLVGAVLCDGVSLADGAGAFEGAVVGSGCTVGAGAAISPGVRLWPRTEVAPGARVDVTLVQSPRWSGRVLRRNSMTGQLGSDLFPENALRVGTAFASLLGDRGPLVVAGDPGQPAALLKQALICGALAAGCDVLDAGATASPVTEYTIRRLGAAGGMHVRWGRSQARVVFYDGAGRPAPRDLARSLEQACARQDFPRATHETAGHVEGLPDAELRYLEHLGDQVDGEALRSARPGVALAAGCWPVLHRWLERLGCRVLETGGPPGIEVDRVGADPPAGARLLIGVEIDRLEATWQLAGAGPEQMLALDLWLRLRHSGGGAEPVPLPVTAPRALEEMVRRWDRVPVRVRQEEWRPQDPLLAIGQLLCWMAGERLTLRDVLAQLPRASTAVRTVACPWEARGRVLRRLLEEQPEGAVELIDGLRIREPEGWALLLPDPDEPLCRVYAEADDPAQAERLAKRYEERVRSLV